MDSLWSIGAHSQLSTPVGPVMMSRAGQGRGQDVEAGQGRIQQPPVGPVMMSRAGQVEDRTLRQDKADTTAHLEMERRKWTSLVNRSTQPAQHTWWVQ